MKKAMVVGMVMFFALIAVGLSFAATGGKLSLKAGDGVYVCGCGEGCPCMTMSMQEGKCTCGKDLVKSKVTRVEGDMAYVMVNGKEQGFKTVGKYMCSCGETCPCKTISQNPGKCSCGKELKAVN